MRDTERSRAGPAREQLQRSLACGRVSEQHIIRILEATSIQLPRLGRRREDRRTTNEATGHRQIGLRAAVGLTV